MSRNMKNFDLWNKLKKQLDSRSEFPFASPREIWWCSMGLNVGVEINGKNENFERPVVIIKAYSTEMLRVVPLTTKLKTGKFYLRLNTDVSESCAVLSQARIISAKRLVRKVSKLSEKDFENIKKGLKELN